MSHNIFQLYLLCINLQIVGVYRLWRIIHWWLMCAVCLSVSLHLSVHWYLSEGADSSKYARINKAMNDVLICHKFHLLCLADAFKCKTKTKKRSAIVTFSYVPPSEKGKTKNYYAYFPKPLCIVELVAVWTAPYVTLFTAVYPSALCWWRMFECELCVQCVQDCSTANT